MSAGLVLTELEGSVIGTATHGNGRAVIAQRLPGAWLWQGPGSVYLWCGLHKGELPGIRELLDVAAGLLAEGQLCEGLRQSLVEGLQNQAFAASQCHMEQSVMLLCGVVSVIEWVVPYGIVPVYSEGYVAFYIFACEISDEVVVACCVAAPDGAQVQLCSQRLFLGQCAQSVLVDALGGIDDAAIAGATLRDEVSILLLDLCQLPFADVVAVETERVNLVDSTNEVGRLTSHGVDVEGH